MYSAFGIANKGCTLISRPDQHISYVGAMNDADSLRAEKLQREKQRLRQLSSRVDSLSIEGNEMSIESISFVESSSCTHINQRAALWARGRKDSWNILVGLLQQITQAE